MKTLLAATALILSMTAANAIETPRASTVLGGGPIYAPTAYYVICEFVNFGPTSITPSSQQLFELGSTAPFGSASSCANGNAVAANDSCDIVNTEPVPSRTAMSCKVTFTGAATNVRGSMQLLDQNDNLLETVELR